MPEPAAFQGSVITINTGNCQVLTSILTGVPNVLINGIPAAAVGSPVVPWSAGSTPGCTPPGPGAVISGNPRVLVGTNPIAVLGSTTAAGPITGKVSANVIVG